jgi:hypothetical protein
MKNNKVLSAILAFTLVLGMASCKTTGSKPQTPKPNTDPKNLVITGIPSTVFAVFKANGLHYELYPVGEDEPVAYSYNPPDSVGRNDNALHPGLYRWNTNDPFKGTGAFDLLLCAHNSKNEIDYDNVYYASIVISEKTTTITWDGNFTKK